MKISRFSLFSRLALAAQFFLLFWLAGSALCDGPVEIPVPLVYSSPAAGASRFAYVLMHYEGTPKDDEYLLGLRVLIQTIKDSGSKQDILIILSENVRESSRSQLLSDGAHLATVPNLQNPFKETNSLARRRTYKARFEFTFNKLYLWALTRYERVLYLDSDNLVLGNLDELFLCGHFCVVYMNPLLFHTGLMVIKPSLPLFRHLVQQLFSPNSYSHDGADQGFLCAQFDVEKAPLFDLRLVKDQSRPLENEAMRLPIGYNLNHFYYYINFNWEFFRRNDYYYRSFDLPGLTLAYPAPAFLKPWFWFPSFYFHHHWTWQKARDSLKISYAPLLLSRVALFGLLVFLARWLHRGIQQAPLEKIRRLCHAAIRTAPVQLGYAVGLACWLFTSVFAFRLVPAVVPTVYGYLLFYAVHTLTMYGLLCGFSSLLVRRGDSEAQLVCEALTGQRALSLFLFYHACTFWVFQPFFVHFIIKIGFVEVTALLWVGYEASVFKQAAVKLTQTKTP